MTIYYEAHITIEPVFGPRLEAFKEIADLEGFRVADLLMQKRLEDTPARSKFDSFCTGRSESLTDLRTRMEALIRWLQHHGFQVWRYKIEDTLMDSRYKDVLNLLSKEDADEHDSSRSADLSPASEPTETGTDDHAIRTPDVPGEVHDD